MPAKGLGPSTWPVSRGARPIRPAWLAELEAIAAAVAPPMILLGARCALRFGEFTELRRGDVDLKAGVLRIRRGVTWLTGTPVVDTPKTEAGSRDVAIPPHLLPLPETHLRSA